MRVVALPTTPGRHRHGRPRPDPDVMWGPTTPRCAGRRTVCPTSPQILRVARVRDGLLRTTPVRHGPDHHGASERARWFGEGDGTSRRRRLRAARPQGGGGCRAVGSARHSGARRARRLRSRLQPVAHRYRRRRHPRPALRRGRVGARSTISPITWRLGFRGRARCSSTRWAQPVPPSSSLTDAPPGATPVEVRSVIQHPPRVGWALGRDKSASGAGCSFNTHFPAASERHEAHLTPAS